MAKANTRYARAHGQIDARQGARGRSPGASALAEVLGALAGRRTNLRLLLLLLLLIHLRVLFLFLTCALHVELCTERSLEMEILLCSLRLCLPC
jgi:hypothetical protein